MEMELYEKIEEILDSLDTNEIIRVHNEYCNSYGCMDDYIYSMEEFDEIMENESPMAIVSCCFYGNHFNPSDDYFCFNSYANLESFIYANESNSPIYISDIAGYMYNSKESFGLDEVEEIFEEIEEEE